MDETYQRHERISLKEVGKDEKWLQEQIADDPSVLGLGDLTLFGKERRQTPGGRLDVLLSDPETETMYEVEIMLGATDPSHIIRTIEYWDVESRRYPNREHRAVIVAEEITGRFFNVIWLLNRSLPIIAIQLNALRVDGKLLLHFSKVLDIYEPPVLVAMDEEPSGKAVDRQVWERRSSPSAMALFDRFMKLLSDKGIVVQSRYRQDTIALAGKKNFAHITPRKTGSCLLTIYEHVPKDALEAGRSKLEEAGVQVRLLASGALSVSLSSDKLENSSEVLAELMRLGAKVNSD
jgi:hypothetical protein